MTINCKGKLIDLSSPKVMGILNITPDSFFDGGKYNNSASIIKQTEKMLSEGATFIDVGAYSSRPGAKHISEEEELNRIVPIIQLLNKEFKDIIISVDTFRSKVAQETVAHGAVIINDISGGTMDENMFQTIGTLKVPYILMHMQGTPQNMQSKPSYNNITKELISFFSHQLFELKKLQVTDVILDVGFGFGKTIEHNYTLLKELPLFKNLNQPLLIGLSRKSMLYKPLEIAPDEALNATTSANTIALLNGVNILRVHDVKEAMQAIKIVEQLR